MSRRTTAYGVKDGIFLCAHGAETPSDAEWDDLIKFHRDKASFAIRMCVVTEGGGPNPKQRAALNKYLSEKKIPLQVAVVFESGLVAGVVKVLSMFNPKMKAFNMSQLDEALQYLGAKPDQLRGISAEVRRLQSTIGGEL